jgi:hypothetical protein
MGCTRASVGLVLMVVLAPAVSVAEPIVGRLVFVALAAGKGSAADASVGSAVQSSSTMQKGGDAGLRMFATPRR